MADPGREPTVSDEDILAVFERSDDPVLTTSEVADQIDIGQRGTYDRLEKLAEQGEIVRKKVSGSAVVWWSPAVLHSKYSPTSG